MAERFIKLNQDTDAADFLARHFPYAFVLLSVIAMRARRTNGQPDGLIIGDAIIGSADLPGMSRQNFRTALEKLVELGHVKIVTNGKSFFEREKSTIKVTIKSNIVNLVKSEIYDINSDDGNQQINQQVTNSQPTGNHKQERIRKNKKEKEDNPQPPSKIKFREFVELTQVEHDTLLAKHGADFLQKMLDFLNAYKGSSGKKYASDYHTMKEGGWVVEKAKKEIENQKAPNEKHFRSATATPPGNTPGSESKFQFNRVLRADIVPEENRGGSHG